LKLEVPSRFKIVAFVDKNNQIPKRMLDLPILTQRKKLPTLMRSIGAEGGLRTKVYQKRTITDCRSMFRV
jgi:hypothetical protein